jgi:pimeloyl-ACP methyl ester carboxylesterase
MTIHGPIAAPSKMLLALEAPRAMVELGLIGPGWPLLRAAPRGDGGPVMLLPGMATSDRSMGPMHLFLRERGYRTYGWKQGRNVGSQAIIAPLLQRLSALRRRHDAPVRLIGLSLGGIYARELARQAPADVRSVITLGSPFKGPHTASNVWRLYEFLSGDKTADADIGQFAPTPPSVPTTAIFTRSDGIVAWQRCIELPGDRVESIEVIGSHTGLGHNIMALYAVADRLAQVDGAWQPFRARGPLRALYPDPWRDRR